MASVSVGLGVQLIVLELLRKKKNLRLKTNNKSTGEAQPANYLKNRTLTDYTTQCQIGNAKLGINDELYPA
jgi:hypothetical protein